MEPSLTEDEFEFLARRAGLSLEQGQIANLYEAFGYVEAMVARIRAPLEREAEPAHIFIAEGQTPRD